MVSSPGVGDTRAVPDRPRRPDDADDDRSAPPAAEPDGSSPAAPSVATPGPEAADAPPRRRALPGFILGFGAVLLGAVVAVALTGVGLGGDGGADPGAMDPAADRARNLGALEARAVEASELVGPTDERPGLLEGVPPVRPEGAEAMGLNPTVVTRLLLDERGRVVESRIYRSRPELAAFEEAALGAVSDYRFTPARRDGAAVPVWVNWPVRFRARPSGEPVVLRIKGSNTIGGALGPDLAGAFMERRPEVFVTVESLGSSTAFAGLFDGSADIGASSRSVSEEETAEARHLGVNLREYVLGYDGIAVVVHPSNPVASLTRAELASIFAGRVDDWGEVGGTEGLAIRLLGRPAYSGTHGYFDAAVLERTDRDLDFSERVEEREQSDELVAAIAEDPAAVGYVGLGWVDERVQALPVAAGPGFPPIAPTAASIRSGDYPIYRPLLFYTRGTPTGVVADFLRFAFSAEGQERVRAHGFEPSGVALALGELGGAGGDGTAVGAADRPGGAGVVPKVHRLFFARATQLEDGSRAALRSLVTEARRGRSRIIVQGHADAEGSEADNRALAAARAEEVADYLTRRGIEEGRIEVGSASTQRPLATNETDAGRRANRRVDVFLVPGG
jgi:phosphate binding protein